MPLPHPNNQMCNRAVSIIPVMVVTHSRRRVLMSTRSQAPASAGAGRGMNLDRVSGMSTFELEAEGPLSVWEW